ncbi:MAG: hypothetical protein KBD78_13830 [Oligoflexales bacterium]|nr:hypothetical protein [Oligoflexales bacterium]
MSFSIFMKSYYMKKSVFIKCAFLFSFYLILDIGNVAFAGCAGLSGCLSEGGKIISDTGKKAIKDTIEEGHRSGHGIMVATKIAGKDVSKEFHVAADNVVREWGKSYRALVPDQKLRQIINSTAALATMYFYPDSTWFILLERKIVISARAAKGRTDAENDIEIAAWDINEERKSDAENGVVLVGDEAFMQIAYQNELSVIGEVYDQCIENAGSDRKQQMKCTSSYNIALGILQEDFF